MNNIPIYRAKKIDSDEWIEGDLIKKLKWYYIAIQDTIDNNNSYDLLTFSNCEYGTIFEIDILTLEISINGRDFISINKLNEFLACLYLTMPYDIEGI